MTHKHHSTWFLSRLLAVILLLGANPAWAEPTIPQDLLDQIAEQGSARVIVGLDIPWQPEGLLNLLELREQRRLITNTQTQFVETLNQDLTDDDLIDSPHAPDGTPTVKAARTFETVPYLVFEVNSVTLPYVQNTPKAKTLQLSVPDQPTMSESLPLIGADKAWDSGHTGAGQAIAIIDTGVDNTHTAFAPNRIIAEACFSVTHCPNGEKTQTGELGAAQPCEFDPDGCGHGTHVAAIAAGTAPEAKIIAIQAASDVSGGGTASFFREDQMAALDWLHANRETFGVPLAAVNMSIGGHKPYSQACDEDSRRKIIQNLESVGIATIISAGNNGYADGISAPACISKAISVGATDKTGQLWPQSNRAGLLDLLAPGVGIESALPGGLTAVKDGTSMAAPHVAGAWAILKAHNPEANVADVLTMLKETGQDVEGMARIQIDAALPQLHATQDLNDGLVAYYPFDGNANDESGNGNHGIVNGASLTEDRFGNADSAYFFNGKDGHITVSNNFAGYSEFTQTVWANIEPQGKYAVIVQTSNGSIHYDPIKKTFLLDIFHDRNGGANNPIGVSSTRSYYTFKVNNIEGKWVHLAFVGLSNNTGGFFVNGNQVSTSPIVVDPGVTGKYNVTSMGTHKSMTYKNTRDFTGMLDALHIYNRALSESEIKQLYGLGSDNVTLTLTKTGEGKITSTDNTLNCGETCEASYEVDSSVTLTATPATGYSFTGWSGDCSGTSATTTATMDAAKSCAATFEKEIVPVSGCDVVSEGLVACYPFDGNANDGSGNGNDGTVNGATLTTDRFGNVESAYSFDGVDDYIEVDKPDNLNFGSTGDLSITAWFKAKSSQHIYPSMLSRRNSGSYHNGYAFFLWSNGGLATQLNSGYVSKNYNSTSHDLRDEIWHYATITADRDGQLTFYVDGVQKGQAGISNIGNIDSISDLTIGWDIGNPSNTYFKGAIDDIRIYNRALSESEIKQLYELDSDNVTLSLTKTGEGKITSTDNSINCGETCQADYEADSTVTLTATPATDYSFTGWSGDCSGTSATTTATMDAAKSCAATFEKEIVPVSGCDVVSEGLVACYPFDGNANDESGNGNHGSENGDVAYVAGKFGEAARFDGKGDYVELSSANLLGTNSSWTFSAWISLNPKKIDPNAKEIGGHTIYGEFAYGSFPMATRNFIIWNRALPDGGITFDNFPPTGSPLEQVPLGIDTMASWHYLVVSRQDNQVSIYLDGILKDQREYERYTGRAPLRAAIGDRLTNNGVYYHPQYSTDGKIDEVRIYNRSLSDSEIKQLYELDSDNDNASDQNTITVNKTGKGRGTVKIDISAEDRTHFCKTDCSEMTQPLFTANEIVLTATPTKGFILKQWAGECSGTENQITVPMMASKTCTADFDLDPSFEMYPLTLNKLGSQGRLVAKGGIDCGEKCMAYYPAGQNVSLEALFNQADTLFLGWKGDCSGFKNRLYLKMDAAKSCTATFKPYNPDEEFVLNVTNGGDGLGTITGRINGEKTSLLCKGKAGCKQAQQEYASGSQLILSAIPEAGFEFVGGSGDCVWESDTDNNGRLRGSATFIMDETKTCTAEFGLKADLTWHTLKIEFVGTGKGSVNMPGRIECGEQCRADYYEAGKAFYIKAEPTALSQFVGWRGNCEGKSTGLKITLNEDMNCIAEFKSDFEMLAEEMVEAFYATATSSDGTPIGDIYPQPHNQARLKEAFWVTITAILQTDYSLILSQAQNWPTQFDGINWLPSDSSTQYTKNVQVVPEQFLGIEVELLAGNGNTEKMGIVIYYTDEAPILDEGIWSRRVVRIAMFSRYAFRRW